MSSKKGAFVYQQIEQSTAEWATDTTLYPASVWLFERLESGKFNMKLADGVHAFADLATVMQDIHVDVKTNDETTYILTITTAAGAFDTPNLKGQNGKDAATVAIDPDTKHMVIGGVDTGVKVEGVNGENGFTPSIAEDAGNTEKIYKLNVTNNNGVTVTPNLRGLDGEKYSIPTLAAEPDETVVSYTVEGITKDFEIGYMARVMDAEKGEYMFWQLYDIAVNKATWKKAGSGGDMQLSETVKITLTGNQAQPDAALNGAVIHIIYGDQDVLLTWQGQELTTTVPMNMTYQVVCPTIEGYTLPEQAEYIALAGNTRGLSFAYNTSVTTINVTADDGADVSGQTITVTLISDSSVIYSGAAGTVVIKIPFGAECKVSVNAMAGYKAVPDQTITASEVSRTVNLVYKKIRTSRVVQDDAVSDPQNITGDVNGDIIQQIRAKIRRCLAKKSANGEITIRYLKNENSTQYDDGTAAKIDGTEGDVMVYFPRYFYKYESISAYKFAITYSLERLDSTWKELPEYLVGAYEANITSNKVYSRSGVASSGSVSQDNFKTYSRARGTGYQIIDYDQHKMIAWLFYAIYGTRHCQSICGSGTNDYQKVTGQTNTIGNDDTTTANGNSMSVNFLGLENCWGNKYEWIDNVVVNNGNWVITDTVTGVARSVVGLQTNGSWGYPKTAVAGDNLDIIAKEGGMSDSTGYSDGFLTTTSSSRVVLRSCGNSNANGGVAYADANNGASNTFTYCGSRLAFRGVVREAESVTAFKAISVTN